MPLTIKLSRRRALQLAALAGLAAGAPATAAEPPRRLRRARVEFHTSQEALARAIPPPLTAAEPATIVIEWTVAESSAASKAQTPEPYGWCRVFAKVTQAGEPGLYPLGLWTSQEWERWRWREALGANVKPGEIRLKREGPSIEADLESRGQTLARLKFSASEDADAMNDADGALLYLRAPLNSDWTVAEFSSEQIQLAGVTVPAPSDLTESLRADPAQTVLTWDAASPLDPVAEFDVVEIIAADYAEFGALPHQSAVEISTLASLPAADVAAWIPSLIDRPLTDSKPWRPKAWREQSSAYRFSEQELERYRQRKHIGLGPADFCEVEVLIDRDLHASLLPAECRPILRPSLKVMGIRVDSSDVSEEPFNELWLFALTMLDNRPVWYAVSHLVGPGGDLFVGRDLFGYPSKSADISVIVSPVNFSFLARRNQRDVVYGGGGFQGFATGTTLMQMEIATLRAEPGADPANPRGSLLTQLWYFQGRRRQIDVESVSLDCASARPDSSRNVTDPWFEFNPTQLLSAGAYDRGSMQRMPPQTAGVISGWHEHYRERCDGRLPWESRSQAVSPTFRPGRPQSRS